MDKFKNYTDKELSDDLNAYRINLKYCNNLIKGYEEDKKDYLESILAIREELNKRGVE